ncbi:hypothetical protein K08M4_33520 [Vibrio syngnathi]|uniref:Uncharacterized protein n=1 Tax=Vibrio syngnathi TaxID=3034029 RepID=A0AA34TS31_9VIBR|nr:hypothetical protein K08M4_33520 [Vibrio syngnathi]
MGLKLENQVRDSEKDSKKWKSIFGVIFLGALGSGFWEYFLKDFCIKVLDLTVTAASYLFSGFADSLYSNIGNGVGGFLPIFTPVIIMVMMILFPWVFTMKLYSVTKQMNVRTKKVDNDKLLKKIRFFKIATPLLSLLITLMYGHMLFESVYQYKTVHYIERTLEIVRPSVTPQEFLLLRSEYRQINSLEKFEDFYFKVSSVAKENSIELPQFSPLLIKPKA